MNKEHHIDIYGILTKLPELAIEKVLQAFDFPSQKLAENWIEEFIKRESRKVN